MGLEPHPLEASCSPMCWSAIEQQADTKGITLNHELDAELPVVWVNRVSHQVLSNLVGNAVAYTPPGGSVHLGTARIESTWTSPVGRLPRQSAPITSKSSSRSRCDWGNSSRRC